MTANSRLNSLLVEGRDFLNRMERIDAGDRSVRLHLDEIRLWAEDVEKWAPETGFVLPERGTSLDFKIYWEGPAKAYILRVVNRLKAGGSGEMQKLESWARAFPNDEGASRVVSILFLAADPTDATRLRLGEELREIQEKLQLARLRERFKLHQRLSVRPADISQALLDEQPQIVHFSGHGTTAGALCFENQMGETHPIQPDALAALFEQFTAQVKCVVLNACYSEIQANAIAEHVDYVVGMNQAIGDKAAIAFAIGFYQALGAGRTIEEAYKLGCVQIGLQGVPEHLTPVLVKKAEAKMLPPPHHRPSGRMVVSLKFNKEGLVIEDEQELRASLAEALFAAENELQVTFNVLLEPLEVIEGLINSIEGGKASPENRITRVHLLREARALETKREVIIAALPLLLLPPIRNAFASVDELIESLQDLGRLSFDYGSDSSADSHSLDVFRKNDPKVKAVIWIDEAEVEQIEASTGLGSIWGLVGSGWDLFDLPRETRFRKAIPAIVLAIVFEVMRAGRDAYKPFDLLKVLDLCSWSIGLH